MSFVRVKLRRLADGTMRAYRYEVEAYRDRYGQPRQRVLRYLGLDVVPTDTEVEPVYTEAERLAHYLAKFPDSVVPTVEEAIPEVVVPTEVEENHHHPDMMVIEPVVPTEEMMVSEPVVPTEVARPGCSAHRGAAGRSAHVRDRDALCLSQL